jgi:hypothetical protein
MSTADNQSAFTPAPPRAGWPGYAGEPTVQFKSLAINHPRSNTFF